MTFDPSLDLIGVVDFVESASLVRRNGDAVAVARATRLPLVTRDLAASNGQVVAADAIWRLPAVECPDSPEPGDAILDESGRRWTVLSVHGNPVLGWWKCECRDVAVAHGLDDAVTIERTDPQQGDGGSVEPVWRTWRTGVRARIQPADSKTTAKFSVFVAETLAVDASCRIRAADGSLYRITGYRSAERLGELQIIEAEAWE